MNKRIIVRIISIILALAGAWITWESTIWGLKAQRYCLEGSACPKCGQLAFPPRPVCPRCTGQPMMTSPTSSITEAASKQTYYTIIQEKMLV